MQLTPLGSAAEVLVATGHDPYARGALRRPVLRGWTGGGATVWLSAEDGGGPPYLSSLGTAAAVGALLGALLPELEPDQRVTVPRGTPAHLPAGVGLDGTDWDFRWLAAPPPVQPEEGTVVPVTDGNAVRALLAAASQTASASPGDPGVRRWVGIWWAGALAACAADTSGVTGVGHLSSIAVHPAARRSGLGRAVTAALTRQLFREGCEVVTLGMYGDNTVGRRLYDSLGFADEHRWTSGQLEVRTPR